MTTAIVHVSDIHYRQNWYENHGVVLNAFFKDLDRQLKKLDSKYKYFVLTGDVVNAGDDADSYEEFLNKFDTELTSLDIPKCHRICVPGNHDVSISEINSNKIDHEGAILQLNDEKSFNDYSENPADVFKSKFSIYREFESRFAEKAALATSITGDGWDIAEDIGLYGLNSAFFSSGGLSSEDGKKLNDKERLAINTRSLYNWNNSSKAKCKILAMHHPSDWLTNWAKSEIETILKKDFALCISGHAHDSFVFHSLHADKSLVQISAPPLFTDKTDDLGYSIVTINSESEISSIVYRQWTKHHTFQPGVNFANTENGIVPIIKEPIKKSSSNSEDSVNETHVEQYFSKRFSDALTSFSYQPKVWVEPIISKTSELDKDAELDSKVKISEIIANSESTIIKALPQFGLTCLAHHLVFEAYRLTPSSFWLYLDSRMLKPSKKSIKRKIDAELSNLGKIIEDVKCIVLDSWLMDKNDFRILATICEQYKDIRIVLMQTVDSCRLLSSIGYEQVGREFEVLYLWSLSREHIRSVVTSYNNEKHIGEEDAVISRLVADINVLNIHRTPLNCITLLKVSEVDFDESPVNRTAMLNRILFILFNVDNLPTYKTKPDMQDCEYVLGYFCEKMIRTNTFFFTRDDFVTTLNALCKERIMSLDIQTVFEILYNNHILVSFGSQFCFKFTYWIYYFAAQRMHHDKEFAEFIYKDSHYTRFPEVIEFYTGIDRRREDALKILTNDLKRGISAVNEKCGLSDDINPYKFIQWNPSPPMLELMQKEVREGVSASNLPTSIKDKYSDQRYDRRRPYYQEVREILSEGTLISLIQSIKASARALRNSDYVNPTTKRSLLKNIMDGWKQITKVLFVLVPLLAKEGIASFDGISFLLSGDFGDSPEMRLRSIIMELPSNVVSWHNDDLFSPKMGPLLIESFQNEKDDIIKHELALLLVLQRPIGWRDAIQKYIVYVKINSYYLYDIMGELRQQYRFSYADQRELRDLEFLIKMTAAKHFDKAKKPGVKDVKKISNSVLPKRTILND